MGNRVLDKLFVIVLLGTCVVWLGGCESASDDGSLGTGASSSSTNGSESTFGDDCTPSCAFKVCGDDTCGGSCGDCAADEICHAVESLAKIRV